MVNADHQGKGYARQALDLLIDDVRTRPGASELRSSYLEGDESPDEFYRRHGFVPTGDMEESEIGITLAF